METEATAVCYHCGMSFMSISQLSQHRERFCVGISKQAAKQQTGRLSNDFFNEWIQRLHTTKYKEESEHKCDLDATSSQGSSSEEQQFTAKLKELLGEVDILEHVNGQMIPYARVNEMLNKFYGFGANENTMWRDDVTAYLNTLGEVYGQCVPVHVVRKLFSGNLEERKQLWDHIKQQMLELKGKHIDHMLYIQSEADSLKQKRQNVDDKLAQLAKQSRAHASTAQHDYLFEEKLELWEKNIQKLMDTQVGNEVNKPEAYKKKQIFQWNGGSLVAEISALRQHYISSGGEDAGTLAKFATMLDEAELIGAKSKAVPLLKANSGKEEIYAFELENQRLQKELLLLEQRSAENRQLHSIGHGAELDRTLKLRKLQSEHEQQVLEMKKELELTRHRLFLEKLRKSDETQEQLFPVSEISRNLLATRLPPRASGRPSEHQGFTCFYDFVLGLEPSTRLCKLIVSLYSKDKQLGKPSMLPEVRCETTEYGQIAMIGARQDIPECVPSEVLGLVIELQTSSSTSDSLLARAWLKVDLFHERMLMSGAWKFPFRIPPIQDGLSSTDDLPPHLSVMLYMRLANSYDADSQALVTISSDNVYDYSLLQE